MSDWISNTLELSCRAERADEVLAWLKSWETDGVGADLWLEDDGADRKRKGFRWYTAHFETKWDYSDLEWRDDLREAFGEDIFVVD